MSTQNDESLAGLGAGWPSIPGDYYLNLQKQQFQKPKYGIYPLGKDLDTFNDSRPIPHGLEHMPCGEKEIQGLLPRGWHKNSEANKIQIGGEHYKSKAIEPWDYISSNNLDYFQGNIVKYVTRWKTKGGVEDLRKAMHYLQKYIEETDGKSTTGA